MTKQITALMLALLMVFSLAACGGSGEEAGSKAPAEAAAPEESAAPVVSCQHSWLEANCQSPRTCSLCGETEGEAKHSYGEWSISSDSEMSRSCGLCGGLETAALDHEQVFTQHLLGYWDKVSTVGADKEVSVYNSVFPLYEMMSFNADGSGNLQVASILAGYSWQYTGYELRDSAHTYNFYVEYSDGSGGMNCVLILGENGEPDILSYGLEGTGGSILTQNKDTTKLIPGRYVCGDFYLDLNEDRSVSGDVNGPMAGYWTALPVVESSEGYIFGLSVSCSSVGDYDFSDTQSLIESNWSAYISMDVYLIGESAQALESFDRNTISINFTEDGYCFRPEAVTAE